MYERTRHATVAGGKIGEGPLGYPPGSSDYDEALRHIGGIKPPWPDTPSAHSR